MTAWRLLMGHHYVRISRVVPGQFPVGRPGKVRFHIVLGVLTTYFKIRTCCVWPFFHRILELRRPGGGIRPYWTPEDGGMSSWNMILRFELGFLEPKGRSCWKGLKNLQVEHWFGLETRRKHGRVESTPTISISFRSGAPILTNVVHVL
jgi:hypothetical protein